MRLAITFFAIPPLLVSIAGFIGEFAVGIIKAFREVYKDIQIRLCDCDKCNADKCCDDNCISANGMKKRHPLELL